MTSPRASTLLRAACTGVACAWVALLLLAPGWATRSGSGTTGGRATMAALVRLAGAQVCHQRPERSFHLHGHSLAVCGRCTGLYLAGAAGLVAGVGPRRRRQPAANGSSASWWRRDDLGRWVEGRAGLDPRAGWLALASMPTLATWTAEVAGLWNPGTPLRAWAAVPLGLTAGWLIGRALDH